MRVDRKSRHGVVDVYALQPNFPKKGFLHWWSWNWDLVLTDVMGCVYDLLGSKPDSSRWDLSGTFYRKPLRCCRSRTLWDSGV